MPAHRDPPTVVRHDAEHLRRFLAARRAGDAAAMRRWWEALVIDVFDRVDGLVAATHRGRLDDDEHELAVQLALVRISTNLMTTYAGTSMGELVNAIRTLCHGICIDVQRRSQARRARERLELDAGWNLDRDAARGAQPWAEGDEAVRRHERQQQQREREDFLDWALPQLNGNRGEVLRMTLDGVPLDDIAATLQTSRDNAHQLRSRGIKDLKKLKERYDG